MKRLPINAAVIQNILCILWQSRSQELNHLQPLMPSNLNAHRKVSFKRKDVASWTCYCHINIKSIKMKHHYLILYFYRLLVHASASWRIQDSSFGNGWTIQEDMPTIHFTIISQQKYEFKSNYNCMRSVRLGVSHATLVNS